MPDKHYTACTYEHLSNDIHKFVFVEASRQSVEDHIAALAQIYAAHKPTDIVKILIDIRPKGWPPMNYTFRQLQNLNKTHPNAPQQRYAFLYKDSLLISIAQSFFKLLNRQSNSARFFAGNREAEAVAWLLS